MRHRLTSFSFAAGIALATLAVSSVHATQDPPADSAPSATVASVYPGLASGALTFAVIAELPEGILVRAGDVEFRENELTDKIDRAMGDLREQMRKNAFFMLEQYAGEKLLLHLAASGAADGSAETKEKTDEQVVQAYFSKVVEDVKVSDTAVETFYQENKDLCGNAPLDQIRDQLRRYVLGQKQQDAVTEHIRTLGERTVIQVSGSWLKEKAVLAKDNPVDAARASGRPSLVDFGANGCSPCDMMEPILDALERKYEGRLNVLFVHVRDNPILGSRYGVRSIPVQVFFDKEGNEVFRHTGFFPQQDIETKLAAMGVK